MLLLKMKLKKNTETPSKEFKDPSRHWPWIIAICAVAGIYLYYFTSSKNLNKTGFTLLVLAYVLIYSTLQRPSFLRLPKALSYLIDGLALLAFIWVVAGIKIYCAY